MIKHNTLREERIGRCFSLVYFLFRSISGFVAPFYTAAFVIRKCFYYHRNSNLPFKRVQKAHEPVQRRTQIRKQESWPLLVGCSQKPITIVKIKGTTKHTQGQKKKSYRKLLQKHSEKVNTTIKVNKIPKFERPPKYSKGKSWIDEVKLMKQISNNFVNLRESIGKPFKVHNF